MPDKASRRLRLPLPVGPIARVSWEAGAAKLTDSRMERESVSFAERERERLKASNMKGE
jgi:hypothetical protein